MSTDITREDLFAPCEHFAVAAHIHMRLLRIRRTLANTQ